MGWPVSTFFTQVEEAQIEDDDHGENASHNVKTTRMLIIPRSEKMKDLWKKLFKVTSTPEQDSSISDQDNPLTQQDNTPTHQDSSTNDQQDSSKSTDDKESPSTQHDSSIVDQDMPSGYQDSTTTEQIMPPSGQRRRRRGVSQVRETHTHTRTHARTDRHATIWSEKTKKRSISG